MAINERTLMLVSTVQKLLRRGATQNIQRILLKTHNADIAGVLEKLTFEEAYEIFRLQPDASERANILSYLDNETQKVFMERLTTDEATEIVENMDSDDAADLLGQLPLEESKDIIEGMEASESTEVVDLMGYPEDTAGGLMNSDFVAFTEDMTVEQAIQMIQSEDYEGRVTFYVYVLNASGVLVGVLSLKQLLLARKNMIMRQLMHPNVITVQVTTDQAQVAQTVERYDFLSVPVVDENNNLVGVVTVDDVIDVIRAEAEEDLLSMGQAGWGVNMTISEHIVARLPWQMLAFITGCICFGIIYGFGINIDYNLKTNEAWGMAAYMPLLLALGAMAGNQSATMIISAIQSGRHEGAKLRNFIGRELLLSLIFSVLFCVLVFVLGKRFIPEVTWISHLSWALGLQIIVAMLLGSLLPLAINKLKWDPTVATVPILTAVVDITSLTLLFGLYFLFQ
jgi:magnesium transporter